MVSALKLPDAVQELLVIHRIELTKSTNGSREPLKCRCLTFKKILTYS